MPEFIENITSAGKPDPPKRPQHPESYLNGPYACGTRRDHQVRIHRSNWPPKKIASLNDNPYVVANCERCGAICLVYDPVPADMTVILYGLKGEEHGHVVEEATGAVVNEEDAPQAGQVVDEPEPSRRGRR